MGVIKEYIKKSSLFKIPYGLYRKTRQYFYDRKNSEKKIKKIFGDEKDKTIYIIRRFHKAGFFSNFFFVLGHIIYADKNGWVPVVDMENYSTLYNETYNINNTRNAWEYYFVQPGAVRLNKAYKYKNQVLSSGYYLYDNVPYYEGKERSFPTREKVAFLSGYVDKYIKINQNILDEADSIRQKWDGLVIGVHIRGTDMKCTPDHPIPPQVLQFIDEIDKLMCIVDISHICVCTDEKAVLEQMIKKYGDKIVCTNSYRSTDGKSIHKSHSDNGRKDHHYLMGKEVLIDAIVLSKCDYLICGHSNVAYAAIVFNDNKYMDVKLLENEEQDKNMR